MGLRYQKRVNLGNGYGLNFGKSGISSSYRTKYGSVGSRGFSIRTGIPGLSFRSSFGKSKKGNGAIVILMILLFIGAAIIAAVVLWNVVLFLIWLAEETYKFVIRKRRKYKLNNEIKLNNGSSSVSFINFSQINFPAEYQKSNLLIEDILVKNGSKIKQGDALAIFGFGENQATLTSDENGKITFYKTPGEKLKIGEYIYKIEKSKLQQS
ncbi:hypothetical protein DHD32_10220 [Arenibacter sp. TNZ]|uniref:DUF4236 domain-containing protein n=1 Tax=Arenibacter TaxID=178469 RepID=UPI000CD45E30|nr:MULTISPECIES: DUF4236 domain-containing protein [Arenibacter]MCM4171857.1 hypothetical protein [Arenibacter sp. TNZ]